VPAGLASQVLVGIDTHDDAAVYLLDGQTGLVATVDVFTPIVDDPRDFGRIAAANALSDVYAMGGTPLFALSVVGFPVTELPISELGQILQGAAEVAAQAEIAILGGHSIDDPEPKFGLCVVGRVDPARVVRNDRARPGDKLVLTKPLGTGIIATAIKRGVVDALVAQRAVDCMVELNRGAAAAMVAAGAIAATDVTGFGLLGHLHELAHASGVVARLDLSAVPVLPGVRKLAEQGVVPGGTLRNLGYFGRWTEFDRDLPHTDRAVIADAQTSGGLLIALAPEQLEAFASHCSAAGNSGWAIVGEVEQGEPGRIYAVGSGLREG
jgi:selenium donor protein